MIVVGGFVGELVAGQSVSELPFERDPTLREQLEGPVDRRVADLGILLTDVGEELLDADVVRGLEEALHDREATDYVQAAPDLTACEVLIVWEPGSAKVTWPPPVQRRASWKKGPMVWEGERSAMYVLPFVAVLAATKASVSDHWFWYLRASYFLGFGFVVVAIWLSLSSKQKEKWWQFFRSIFRASLVAVLLALGSLPLVKLFVNPWLVSNR